MFTSGGPDVQPAQLFNYCQAFAMEMSLKSKKCFVMSILNFPGFLGAGYIVQSAFDCFHSAISEVF